MFRKNKTESKITIVGKEVQSLIDIELSKVDLEINTESPLNQLGMKNGFEIISEFNSQREFGLAFEHVLYMIYETELEIDKTISALIIEIGEQINVSTEHIQKQLKK